MQRMRLPNVANIAENDYSNLIAALVNQAKRECEDAWRWIQLESQVVISTGSGVDSYTLSGFGRRGVVLRVHNVTTKYELRSIDRRAFDRWTDFTDVDGTNPGYYRINGMSGGDPILQLYPPPDAVYTINVYGRVPQDDLDEESDDLIIPEWPVILGAYYLAVSERGDDRGNALPQAQREYQSALSDAIARDNDNRVLGWESDWQVE